MSPTATRRLLDRIGATGSIVCAIHCALLPIAIAVLPSLGIAVWLGDGFEQAFVLFATLLGVFSVVWGYRRHGAIRALGLLVPGWPRCGPACCTRRCTTRWCRTRWR